MQTSLYISTASQNALQKQLEIVANNIANANTIGFKTEGVEFEALVSNNNIGTTSYPTVSDLNVSGSQGVMKETGNKLDVAINGAGFLAIQTPHGTAYTRDGRLSIDQFGQLKSINGHPVLDAGQAPILIQANQGPPTINPDGRIEQNGNVVANLGVFQIDIDQINKRFENSSFFSKTAGIPIALGNDTEISQGFLESSNVNPMKELANLIAISRSFEDAAKTIEKLDQAIGTSIRELGNTQG